MPNSDVFRRAVSFLNNVLREPLHILRFKNSSVFLIMFLPKAEGTTYFNFFRVLAVNIAGQSEPSDISETVICKPVLKPPSAPRDLKSSGTTKTSISLQWVRPDDDGGSKLKGYDLEMRELRRQTWQSVKTVGFVALVFKITKNYFWTCNFCRANYDITIFRISQ